MPTKIRLDVGGFTKWLDGFQPKAIVGQRRQISNCPIAKFVESQEPWFERVEVGAEVTVWQWQWHSWREVLSTSMPEVFEGFMLYIDEVQTESALDDLDKLNVTAEEAVATLILAIQDAEERNRRAQLETLTALRNQCKETNE